MSPGRTIAAIFLAGSIVALGFAGYSASKSLAFWSNGAGVGSVSAEAGGTVRPGSSAQPDLAEGRAMPWLPLFGNAETVAVEQPGATADAASPQFDYALRGVITTGDTRSAILSGSGGDILAREGDVLDDAEIVAINAESIEIELKGETRTITFSEETPIETIRIEPAATTQAATAGTDAPVAADRPAAQDVIFQRMSRDELLNVLREAENKRKERGLPRKSGN